MTLAAGRPREGGITLTLDDLEHLLIDARRDGWLNGEVIETALRLHARDVPAYVMPAARWTCTFWEDFKGAILPPVSPEAQDIYIPVHVGGAYWGLAHFDTANLRMY
jgi:hypothetical protein